MDWFVLKSVLEDEFKNFLGVSSKPFYKKICIIFIIGYLSSLSSLIKVIHFFIGKKLWSVFTYLTISLSSILDFHSLKTIKSAIFRWQDVANMTLSRICICTIKRSCRKETMLLKTQKRLSPLFQSTSFYIQIRFYFTLYIFERKLGSNNLIFYTKSVLTDLFLFNILLLTGRSFHNRNKRF